MEWTKNLIVGLLGLSVFVPTVFADVRVNGYHRKDGTYVRPHYRSSPNHTINDNYSTRGNVNPYTGKAGTVSPSGYTTPSYSSPQNSTRVHTTPHDSTQSSRQVSSRPAMSAYDQGIYDAIAEATEQPDVPAPQQQNRNSHPYVKSFASDGSSWEMAGIIDSSDTLFVDTNSLTDEILYKGIWIKFVGTLKPNGVPAWKGSVNQRVLFDCRSSKYANVAEIVHDSAGKIVSSKQSQDRYGLNLNWSYAVPSTMIGHVYNFACSL